MLRQVNYTTQRVQQLREFISQLEQKLQELHEQEQKKKPRQKSLEKQQRMKSLGAHIGILKEIFTMMQADGEVDDQLWGQFVQLLDSLYQNLDNPAFDNEINTVYYHLRNRRPRVNTDRFVTPLKTIEPFDAQAVQKQAQLVDQNNIQYKLKMMELSYKYRPQDADHYAPTQFKEKLNCKSLLPKYKCLPITNFSKLSVETLFYIFYYHKEPSDLMMAVQELRKQKWLYNKKFGIWLKKVDNKSQVYEETDLYIKGPFIYFDQDQKWQQKRKQDFTFKKKYLM